jgi:hypothetical protein
MDAVSIFVILSSIRVGCWDAAFSILIKVDIY